MLPIKSMMNTMMAAMRTGSNHVYSAGKNMFKSSTMASIKRGRQKDGSA
jgi:hypothetical protein